jgi:hypothetical protein
MIVMPRGWRFVPSRASNTTKVCNISISHPFKVTFILELILVTLCPHKKPLLTKVTELRLQRSHDGLRYRHVLAALSSPEFFNIQPQKKKKPISVSISSMSRTLRYIVIDAPTKLLMLFPWILF